jgi:hypothetical protein
MALDWARPVPHDLTDTLTRWKTEDNFSSSFPHPDIILLSDCVYYEVDDRVGRMIRVY